MNPRNTTRSLSLCLSVRLSVCPSVSLSVSLSVCLPVCLSLFVCLSVHPSVRPSVRLSVCLSVTQQRSLITAPSVRDTVFPRYSALRASERAMRDLGGQIFGAVSVRPSGPSAIGRSALTAP